jgi:hypothetical protein
MSQSGIPVVSQAAAITNAAVSVPIDILSGKNVGESLGRDLGTVVSAFPSFVHQTTAGLVDQVPIFGGLTSAADNFMKDPYSKKFASDLAVNAAKTGIAAGGAAFGGPAIAGATGLGGTASSILGGKVAYDLSSGNISKAFNSAAPALTGLASGVGTDLFGNVGIPEDLVSGGQSVFDYWKKSNSMPNLSPKPGLVGGGSPLNGSTTSSMAFIWVSAGVITYFYLKRAGKI